MNDDLLQRLRLAAMDCDATVVGRLPRTPAEELRALGDACEQIGIDSWDTYGESGPVDRLEGEVADLLGKEAAAYFPSGTMAQQIALRVWSDRAATRRIALPDLSHLLRHELDGPRLLQGFEVDHLTTGAVTATAEHLAALPGRLAAVLVELPLRDAGCLLPEFDELGELAVACADRDIRLHVDGARIWEAAAAFDRPVSEVAASADSVYVSFYKGLGGLSGCCLAGPADFVDESRRWRTRLGGTIYRTTPEAVAALVGLRDELPLMRRCFEWALALAEGLPERVRVRPAVPHTNTFLLYAEGDADAINERLLAFLEEHRLVPTGPWRAADEPGRASTEIAVSSGALELDPADIAVVIGELVA